MLPDTFFFLYSEKYKMKTRKMGRKCKAVRTLLYKLLFSARLNVFLKQHKYSQTNVETKSNCD